MIVLRLAWRNIWRNKRRTGITLASIFFAVILSSLMMSVKEGVYKRMIDASVGDFMGYVQIHAKDYWEEKTLDYSFSPSPEFLNELSQHPNVQEFLPRIESFALAAAQEVTKGSMVVGIDVEKEKRVNNLDARISEGNYLNAGDDGILVGHGLAKYLNVGIGDTLVLLGQGYHGSSAAGKYPIKGLVKFGSPELSKQLIFMPIDACKILYGTDDNITSLILSLKNNSNSLESANEIQKNIAEDLEVMHWTGMNKELVEMIEADRVEGYVFMFVLYMVIAFGIFGTSLMMLAERRREFGILTAIGMKRSKLAIMVWLEVMFISLMGAFLGMFGAYPICYYLYANPIVLEGEMMEMTEEYGMEAIIQASVDLSVFTNQGIVVAIIASIIAIYPLVKLLGIKAINEMRS